MVTRSGAIYLRRTLIGLTDEYYQLLIKVKDGGKPSLTDEAIVNIKVIRNRFKPIFLNAPYFVTITGPGLETNSEVIKIETQDQDTIVSVYIHNEIKL